MPIRFEHPALLWLVLLGVPIVWLGMRNLVALEPVRRWSAIGIRLGVLVVIVLMLGGLQTVQRHSDLTVIAVVDQSRSVETFAQPPTQGRQGVEDGSREPAGDGAVGGGAGQGSTAGQAPDNRSMSQWVERYVRQASGDKRDEDKFGWITFDGQSTVRSLPRIGMDMDQATIESPTQGTDASEAIRTALALYPADSGARMLLVSDGNDTGSKQQVLQAAREAAAAGIPIDVLPINYSVDHEVMVEGVYAPTQARKGQTVAVRVVMRGTRPAEGRIQLKARNELIDLNGPNSPGTGMAVTGRDWSLSAKAQAQATDPSNATQDSQDEGAQNQANHDSASPTENPPASNRGSDAETPGRYVLAKQIDLPMHDAGANEFEAIFEPSSSGLRSAKRGPGNSANAGANRPTRGRADTVRVNNQARTFTLVEGEGKVLFIDNLGGKPGKILPQTLRDHGVKIQVAPPQAIPSSLRQLQQYDAVVFQNVSADLVTGPQQKAIERFVHDLGGGFVMIGGPDAFGAGAWTNTAIDKHILPVSCQIPSQTILPSGALVIVLDRSGSMGGGVQGSSQSKLELANEAAVLALSTLYPQDIRGVVAFDGGPKWIVKTALNSDPAQTARKVRSIHPGGGTNIYSGLKEAYESLATLKTKDTAVKHVILLTDGHSMAPPGGGGYVKLVGQMAAHDITLSTVGVGNAHNSSLLNRMASMGGGRYHPIKNPNNLPQVFIKEAKVVRKNLVKEQTFKPRITNTASPIISGISNPPALKGFVLTGPKNDPRVFQPMEGPEGEPIFAHWQVGLGRSAAFTSDATNRWASQWLRWGGYADFWSRLMRNVSKPAKSRSVDLQTDVVGDQLKVRLDAASYGDQNVQSGEEKNRQGGASFRNFLNVKGAVLKPDGTTTPLTLEQTGPGVYEASVPAKDSGNYIVDLFMNPSAQSGGGSGHPGTANDDQRQRVVGGASKPPGAELRKFESDLPLLRKIAQSTGGRMLDPTDAQLAGLYQRGQQVFESQSIRPLWRTLLIWLLVLFLLDVANRRIAWDPHGIAAWCRRMAGSLVLRSPAEESTQTLGSLRKRRAATQAAHAQSAAAPAGATGSAAGQAPAPSKERKFDAPDNARANPDFAEAVGGARQDGTSRTLVTAAMQKGRAAETGHAEDTGPTTDRLRDAKRRARERLKQDDQ